MSPTHQQTNGPQAKAGGAASGGALPPQDEEQVRVLLARGSTKSAVELAKEVHKRFRSPASEGLLVDAYAARIRSLLEHGLTTEAKALLDLARERYSCAKEKLAQIGVAVAGRQTDLKGLLSLLNDPAIPDGRRAAIEDTIKRQVTDLSALAECATLSPEHPLRAGAAALQRALDAVTSGPVTEAALSLPGVSHRGPLAPWKLLVRAIAYFYRKDDAACERCLQAIDPGSTPARLVPALRAMLSQKSSEPLEPAAAALVSQVAGNMETLRGVVEALDAAFRARKQSKIFPAIQGAISVCRSACPELIERLRQHISIRAVSLDLPVARVQGALGGPSIKDAYFWRLYARATESLPGPRAFVACSLWEEFRRHAVAEGWFAEQGPEAAALYLHMAGLLRGIPREELEVMRAEFMAVFRGHGHYYKDQPPAIREVAARFKIPDFYFIFQEQLFERACSMDPHREAFEQWLAWAERESDWKGADRVAVAWRRALPNDSRPLFYLMEAAEKRGALKKAFGFLEEAEKLDGINPQVRRAALRLLVARAIRHLQQRKPHLAEQELSSLEALPQAAEGDRPAFLAALRWTCCLARGDARAASDSFTQASRLLQSSAAAILTCGGAGEACGFGQKEFASSLPPEASVKQGGPIAAAVARACALGDDMGVPFIIPAEWESLVRKELSDGRAPLEVRELRALGEAALRRDRRALAYAASASGLAKGVDAEARFLLLRARALPDWDFERQVECIRAATELGRQRRDMDVVAEAVELRRRRERGFWIDDAEEDNRSMTAGQLNAVLQRERQSSKFPTFTPAPSRKPFKYGSPTEDKWEEDEDGDEIGMLGLGALNELIRKVLGVKTPGIAPQRVTPRKDRSKSPPRNFPDQGDLPF